MNKRVTLRLTEQQYDRLLSLVKEGLYSDVPEAIKDAVRHHLEPMVKECVSE